jgi:hypothetical protein
MLRYAASFVTVAYLEVRRSPRGGGLHALPAELFTKPPFSDYFWFIRFMRTFKLN